ncbi:MAG: DUF1294 domain-containing protein [Lachnospiraceae bacterium]|nr:DUF1294 domain-containing protein [Lachnospiraceae bacterium]
MNDPLWIVFIAIPLMNLFAFFLMGWDKHCAKKGKLRVPEATLFLAAACFGALGGTLGMFLFRHKTKHWYFRVFFPLFLLAQAGLILWVVLK